MDTNRIPAGLTDLNIEIFVIDDMIKFIKNGTMHHFEMFDVADLAVIREEMERNPSVIDALEAMHIFDPVQQIRQYILCNFSDFDSRADITATGIVIKEYVPCNKRGSCPFEGKLCTLPSGSFGHLTQREIEIIKLIATDLADKQIADKLNIAYHTVCVHRANIEHKIGCHSKVGITAFAYQNNLL